MSLRGTDEQLRQFANYFGLETTDQSRASVEAAITGAFHDQAQQFVDLFIKSRAADDSEFSDAELRAFTGMLGIKIRAANRAALINTLKTRFGADRLPLVLKLVRQTQAIDGFSDIEIAEFAGTLDPSLPPNDYDAAKAKIRSHCSGESQAVLSLYRQIRNLRGLQALADNSLVKLISDHVRAVPYSLFGLIGILIFGFAWLYTLRLTTETETKNIETLMKEQKDVSERISRQDMNLHASESAANHLFVTMNEAVRTALEKEQSEEAKWEGRSTNFAAKIDEERHRLLDRTQASHLMLELAMLITPTGISWSPDRASVTRSLDYAQQIVAFQSSIHGGHAPAAIVFLEKLMQFVDHVRELREQLDPPDAYKRRVRELCSLMPNELKNLRDELHVMMQRTSATDEGGASHSYIEIELLPPDKSGPPEHFNTVADAYLDLIEGCTKMYDFNFSPSHNIEQLKSAIAPLQHAAQKSRRVKWHALNVLGVVYGRLAAEEVASAKPDESTFNEYIAKSREAWQGADDADNSTDRGLLIAQNRADSEYKEAIFNIRKIKLPVGDPQALKKAMESALKAKEQIDRVTGSAIPPIVAFVTSAEIEATILQVDHLSGLPVVPNELRESPLGNLILEMHKVPRSEHGAEEAWTKFFTSITDKLRRASADLPRTGLTREKFFTQVPGLQFVADFPLAHTPPTKDRTNAMLRAAGVRD